MHRSSELPDDQSVQWPTDTVAESILQYIEMYKINAVVTFDKYGVSGHKNHVSLYFAVAALCIEKKVPSCQYRFAQFMRQHVVRRSCCNIFQLSCFRL